MHNNFINTEQASLIESFSNRWDDEYPSGGNYWSDHVSVDEKSGPNQDQPGSDGFSDTPYAIDDINQDNYPFVKPWTPSPLEVIQELIKTLETWNLPKGTENCLTSKLDGALRLLNEGNENGAIHKLVDFIDQVESLRDKKLTNLQADYLVSEAQGILDLV